MDFEESGFQSLLVIMASKKKMLPSILETNVFAVESKFLSILSIVASYVKSSVEPCTVWEERANRTILYKLHV